MTKKIKTIRPFDDSIFSREIDTNNANKRQVDLLKYILEFHNKPKPRLKEDNEKKMILLIVWKPLRT